MFRITITKDGTTLVLKPLLEVTDAIYWRERLSEIYPDHTVEVVRA